MNGHESGDRGKDSRLHKNAPVVDELVESVTLFTDNHWLLHGHILPFFFMYLLWLYIWTVYYGIDEYFEAGMITLAGIGILQVFVCLCMHWSVHVMAFMTCVKVYLKIKSIFTLSYGAALCS